MKKSARMDPGDSEHTVKVAESTKFRFRLDAGTMLLVLLVGCTAYVLARATATW